MPSKQSLEEAARLAGITWNQLKEQHVLGPHPVTPIGRSIFAHAATFDKFHPDRVLVEVATAVLHSVISPEAAGATYSETSVDTAVKILRAKLAELGYERREEA